MTFARGQLIADRFRLLNRIGQGALGELWRAADRVPDRQVAIRRVAPFGESATRRMMMEVDAARAVRDRCVARVHRVGTLADGTSFVATELLMSESLDDLLERRKRLTPGAALSLVSDIARAVAAAHERRIAHRAISPRTVLLHRDERGSVTPKLVDFGRSAVLEPLAPYASPEQLTDDTGSGYETDVWALGALLFRCVTGEVPFATMSDVFEAERIIRGAKVHEHVREVLLGTLQPARSQRLTPTALADTAQVLAWRVPGGFRDLEKMVRIHASVWLDASATGAVDHLPTIPALGGGPPPRDSEPPPELWDPELESASADNIDDDSLENFDHIAPRPREIEPNVPIPIPIRPVPLPQAEPESPPPPPAAPIDEPLPAAHISQVPDEVFVDFRSKRPRRHVVYGAAAVAALAILGLASVASTKPQRPRAARTLSARGNAPTANTANTAPTPTASPTIAAVAAVAAARPLEPKHALLSEPEPPKSNVEPSHEKESEKQKPKEPTKKSQSNDKPVEKASTSSPPIPSMAGIPLWDPKPVKAENHENPYE